jgi:hypothetical protein
MLRWPFRKRPPARNEDTDPDLERVRVLRARTERLTGELEKYANQLEVALNKNDRRRMGRT